MQRAEADILDPGQCACARLRKASRMVTRFYDQALRPAEITPNQFTILATLERTGAIAQSELAARLAMDRTTLLRNLKPLIARGLVAQASRSARRVKTLSLTPAGGARLLEALPLWRAAQSSLSEALGEERWHGLSDGLDQALEAVASA